MLRRVPPALLALGATVVVLGIVIGVFLGLGGGQGQQTVPPCTTALEQGPYGCVRFVSVSGSVGGQAAAEADGGGITYRIERSGDGFQLVFGGDCAGGAGPVAVTATRYRVGTIISGQQACAGADGSRDAWGRALFTGTVAVTERDDATVELVNGDRRALFAEVVAPRS